HGLPIDPHQREELFLTAAQSFFALSLLVTLSISTTEALVLFALFWAQFVIGALVPESFGGLELVGLGFAYLVLGALVFVRDRGHIAPLARDGFRTPYRDLAGRGSLAEVDVGEQRIAAQAGVGQRVVEPRRGGCGAELSRPVRIDREGSLLVAPQLGPEREASVRAAGHGRDTQGQDEDQRNGGRDEPGSPHLALLSSSANIGTSSR